MKRKNYFTGLAGALIGGLVGTIPWIVVSLATNFFIGFLGYLIGISALYGYRMLNGYEGPLTKWIILVVTILSVVVAQMASYIFSFYQEGYGLSITNLFILFEYPEFVKEFLINIGIGSIIAFLGIKSIFDEL